MWRGSRPGVFLGIGKKSGPGYVVLCVLAFILLLREGKGEGLEKVLRQVMETMDRRSEYEGGSHETGHMHATFSILYRPSSFIVVV